jgi:hypothetical protein
MVKLLAPTSSLYAHAPNELGRAPWFFVKLLNSRTIGRSSRVYLSGTRTIW